MKITPVKTIYLVSTPFDRKTKKAEMLTEILCGRIIISGIKKSDLESIVITTTIADALTTPKIIRLEVDSRHLSAAKLEKILTKAINEVRVMFTKENKHLAEILLNQN